LDITDAPEGKRWILKHHRQWEKLWEAALKILMLTTLYLKLHSAW